MIGVTANYRTDKQANITEISFHKQETRQCQIQVPASSKLEPRQVGGKKFLLTGV